MPEKTQTELEKPAKVYQLNAVEAKVDQALLLLDRVDKNTSGLVTQEQLKESETRIIKMVKQDVRDEIDKVHLEYRPVKRGAFWFAGVLVTSVMGIAVATWKALTGVQ